MLQVGLAEHTKLSVDQRVMDVNFLGVLSLTKAVLPHFLEKEDGHITVISSPGGKLGKENIYFSIKLRNKQFKRQSISLVLFQHLQLWLCIVHQSLLYK